MTVFSIKKKIFKSKKSSRACNVRFSEPSASLDTNKDPRVARAIRLRAPSPFPGTRSARQRKGARARRPILVQKGTVGTKETSESETCSGEDVILIGQKAETRSQDSRLARYERRTTYKTGDHVLVLDGDSLGRSIWRHGVVADLNEHPPFFVTEYGGLVEYPVFYEDYGEKKMAFFRPMRCGMMYDKVLSTASSGAEPRY
ncbi:hypothetical protein C8Q79DRAFT_919838 [Trametes meyenii]|nr:hypothetical protein C8Q79DRAFT_919838 [Trametes meyenii]